MEPGVRNPARTQGAATFRRTLDMRDGHPADMGVDRLRGVEVTTPHRRD